MNIKTVGVVGAGSMGSGIANLAAMKGYKVILRDLEERLLQTALERINKFMEKSVARGKMTEKEKKETLSRIQTTTDMASLREADIVIEAVFENLDLKKESVRPA